MMADHDSFAETPEPEQDDMITQEQSRTNGDSHFGEQGGAEVKDAQKRSQAASSAQSTAHFHLHARGGRNGAARRRPENLARAAAQAAYQWSMSASLLPPAGEITDPGTDPRRWSAEMRECYETMHSLAHLSAATPDHEEAAAAAAAMLPMALQLAPEVGADLRPLLPTLLQGSVGLVSFLRRRQETGGLVVLLPVILAQTVLRIAAAIRHHPVSGPDAARILAEQAARTFLRQYQAWQPPDAPPFESQW